MSIAASLSGPADAGWLRSAPFDLTFMVGTTMLAVITGWVVVMDPSLFVPLLILIYLTINFDTYVVGGIIRRSRKSKNIPAAAPDGQRG